MHPVISVIVCTYNQQDTIGRTLDSILMQQCHVPFEIVIGEDCSTDRTLTICQDYLRRYPDIICLLANEHNKGVVDNYFDCILACRGEYIADCAGDDFWVDPLKLEKEVSIMERHPEVTLVHTNWNSYNKHTGKTRRSPQKPFEAPFTTGKEMLEAIIIQTKVPVIHLGTSLYRNRIIRETLLTDDSQLRNKEYGCEDLQIGFLMALQGTIAYLPEVTLNYSQGGESVSYSANHQKQFCFTLRTSNLSWLLAQRHHIHTQATEQYFQQRIFALAMHAFRAHEPCLRDKTLETEQAWQCGRPLRSSLLFYIMRHHTLWRLALQVRNVVIYAKRALQ